MWRAHGTRVLDASERTEKSSWAQPQKHVHNNGVTVSLCFSIFVCIYLSALTQYNHSFRLSIHLALVFAHHHPHSIHHSGKFACKIPQIPNELIRELVRLHDNFQANTQKPQQCICDDACGTSTTEKFMLIEFPYENVCKSRNPFSLADDNVVLMRIYSQYK